MAQAAEAAAPANDVQVEDVGPARKKLTITIPREAVQEKLEQSVGTLMAESALPGFRKGRAPRQLIEKRFGAAMRTEARNQLVAESFAAAIEQHGLKPIGEPIPVTPMDEITLESGKGISFAIEVEVAPEFEIPKLEGIEIKRPIMEITDGHVGLELKRQQFLHGRQSEIDGGFQALDRLSGRAVVRKAGEEAPIFEHDDVLVIVPTDENDGRGQVLGLLVERLAGMLAGRAVGDTVSINVTAPESHEREDIRGAALTIEFNIRRAVRVDPAVPQQVAEQFGLESEEILREQIRLALEQRRDQEQSAAMREQVFEHLLRDIEFELPEKLSTSSVSRTLDRMRMELLYRGMSVDDVETRIAEVRAESEAETRKRIRLFFILHRLAEQFGVEASEMEVNGRIAAMAIQRRIRPEKLRQELAQTGQLGEVSRQIREHKVADRIIQTGKLTDVPAEEWNRLVAERSREAGRARAASRLASPRPAPVKSAKVAEAAEKTALRTPATSAPRPPEKPAAKPPEKPAAKREAAAPAASAAPAAKKAGKARSPASPAGKSKAPARKSAKGK